MADDNLNYSFATKGLGKAMEDIFDVWASVEGAQALSEKISGAGEGVPRLLNKASDGLLEIAKLLDEVGIAISLREKEFGQLIDGSLLGDGK